MKDTPKAPTKDTSEPSALEQMRELTRRLVAVPKSELPTKPKVQRRKRH